MIGLILWPLFFGVFGVVIAFFWAVVAIKLLKSRLSKNCIICFYILLVVSLALSSINAIIGFFIWLWILKACKLEFKSKGSKVLLYFSSIMLLVSAWQMEIPQRVMFEALTLNSGYKIEIVDENYTLPVNHMNFSVGRSKNYSDCVKDFYKCPLPLPNQLRNFVYENRSGKEILIANIYSPYYSKTLLLNYFEKFDYKNFKLRIKFVKDKDIYKYLENQKLANKGENNGKN